MYFKSDSDKQLNLTATVRVDTHRANDVSKQRDVTNMPHRTAFIFNSDSLIVRLSQQKETKQ